MLRGSRNIFVIASGALVLVFGLLAATGYGLDLPRLHSLGNSDMSFPTTLVTMLVGGAILLIGIGQLEKQGPQLLFNLLMKSLVSELTHPHERYRRADALLQEFIDLPLEQSEENRAEMKQLMAARCTDMSADVDEAERKFAKDMLDIIEIAERRVFRVQEAEEKHQ